MKIRYLILTSVFVASVCRAADTGDYDAGSDIVALPRTAEQFLLAKLQGKKISGISQMVFRRFRGFDYLGVEGGFEVAWGASWEKAFIHDFVLRKKVSDPDWSNAELFDPTMPVIALFCAGVPIDESELKPWKKPDATNKR